MPSIEALEKLIELCPGDPFPRYGLAMELKKQGRLEEAVGALEDLIRRFQDYVPGHHQLARALEAAGRGEEAGEAYRRGIEAARRTGDSHAAEEMQGALEELPPSSPRN
jgi:tetratricopeptide (TPR) repeat protein